MGKILLIGPAHFVMCILIVKYMQVSCSPRIIITKLLFFPFKSIVIIWKASPLQCNFL